MKTNYSRLLLTFVSFVSMATTLGLSTQPGLSARYGDICTYEPTGEKVTYIQENEDNKGEVFVKWEDQTESYVSISDLINCAPPGDES